MNPIEITDLVFIFILSLFLGFELIRKIPSIIHTPLMSGSNAISGITLIGALIVSGHYRDYVTQILGFCAVFFATINVVGGYIVTDRMLSMFKKEKNKQ